MRAPLRCAILFAAAACGRNSPPPATVDGAARPVPAPVRAEGWPAWACRMGPVVGATGMDPVVTPGEYRGAFDFRRHKIPTMERSITQAYRGATALTLEADGTMRGCFGIDRSSSSSVGKYESPDGQHHTHQDRYRVLFGVRGRWEAASDGARVIVERHVVERCDAPEAEMSPVPGFQLVCGTLAANQKLPGRALVCRSLGGLPLTDEIALDLGENERAGPWATRYDIMSPAPPDPKPPCGPWILFGAAPGLLVTSDEDPRATAPTVTFTAGAPPFVEKDFLEPKPDAGPR